jgi:hypothetical protein
MQDIVNIINRDLLTDSSSPRRNKTIIEREKKRIATVVRGLAAVHKKVVCDIKKNEARNA